MSWGQEEDELVYGDIVYRVLRLKGGLCERECYVVCGEAAFWSSRRGVRLDKEWVEKGRGGRN